MPAPPIAAPTRPPRPATVTVAFWFQVATVALLLLLVGLVVTYAVHVDGVIDRAARLVPDADPAEVSGERTGNVVFASVGGGIALVLTISRRRRPSRCAVVPTPPGSSSSCSAASNCWCSSVSACAASSSSRCCSCRWPATL